jgi:hypothetical protein
VEPAAYVQERAQSEGDHKKEGNEQNSLTIKELLLHGDEVAAKSTNNHPNGDDDG